ncbi:MAG: hypothetical protein NTW86_04435, partial [Candidatus Sumerlaeota bacterium]|nr:hypothetical protein [Candidatus Sumerlaeota bacterium]
MNRIVRILTCSVSFALGLGWSSGASEPLRVLVSKTGSITVMDIDANAVEIEPGFNLDEGGYWTFAEADSIEGEGQYGGVVKVDDEKSVALDASVAQDGNALKLSYTLTPSAPMKVKLPGVAVRFAFMDWQGAPLVAGKTEATVPGRMEGWETPFESKKISSLKIGPAPELGDLTVAITLPQARPTFLKQGWTGGQNLSFRFCENES